MLVLTRKASADPDSQEAIIHIGDGIQVQILAARGDRIRVGIIAPADVVIRRGEIPEMTRKEIDRIGIDDAVGNK